MNFLLLQSARNPALLERNGGTPLSQILCLVIVIYTADLDELLALPLAPRLCPNAYVSAIKSPSSGVKTVADSLLHV